MQNKYGDQGFTVMALSDEGASVVEKFVKEQKLTYPIGIDTGGKTKRAYGVSGIPHAFLLDVDGRVIWEGNPGGGEYEQQLTDALMQANAYVPAKPLGKGFEKVGEQLKNGDFAEAIKLARAGGGAADEVESLLGGLAAKAKSRIERAKKLDEVDGRTFEASLILNDVATRFAGLDEAVQAKTLLDGWKADKAKAEPLAVSQAFYEAEQAEAKGNEGPARAKYLSVAKMSTHKLASLAQARAKELK